MHTLPDDLKKALASNSKALKTWEIVTPLARNEWICWVTSGDAQTLLLVRMYSSPRQLRRPDYYEVEASCPWKRNHIQKLLYLL